MKIMETSSKRSCAHTPALSARGPVAGHLQPTPPLETPGHSRASLVQSLVGSLLLSPGSWCAPGFVCALKESVSSVLCRLCNQSPLQSQITWEFSVPLPHPQVGESVVGPRTFLTVQEFLWYNCSAVCGSSAWQHCGGVNGDLLQGGLCHRLCDQVSCNQSPYICPCSRPLLTRTSAGDTDTQFWLCLCGSLGPGAHKVLFEPPSVSGKYGVLILNVLSPLLPSYWGFSFALGHGVSFFGGIQHSSVDGCSAVSCNFGVLAGDECTSFYSVILSCGENKLVIANTLFQQHKRTLYTWTSPDVQY